MPLKAANFATATDTEILFMDAAVKALTGSTVVNMPIDIASFQLDVLRPLLVAEIYRRGLIPILRINALP